MIFPPDMIGTRIKNAKFISLAIEAYGIMCWVTAILTFSRISEMLGISAYDAIGAGVPNTGFTLVVGPRQVPVACSP